MPIDRRPDITPQARQAPKPTWRMCNRVSTRLLRITTPWNSPHSASKHWRFETASELLVACFSIWYITQSALSRWTAQPSATRLVNRQPSSPFPPAIRFVRNPKAVFPCGSFGHSPKIRVEATHSQTT